VFKCTWCFFIEFSWGNQYKIIVQSIISKHWGVCFYHFGEFFCQPYGKNTFSKMHPKQTDDHKIPFSMPKTCICAEPLIKQYCLSKYINRSFEPHAMDQTRDIKHKWSINLMATRKGVPPRPLPLIDFCGLKNEL